MAERTDSERGALLPDTHGARIEIIRPLTMEQIMSHDGKLPEDAPSVQAETPNKCESTAGKTVGAVTQGCRAPDLPQPASPDARELKSIAEDYLNDHKHTWSAHDLFTLIGLLTAQRQAGEQAGLERAAQAICVYCDEGIPLDKNGRHTGGSHVGTHCYAHAIRTLLPDPKVKP